MKKEIQEKVCQVLRSYNNFASSNSAQLDEYHLGQMVGFLTQLLYDQDDFHRGYENGIEIEKLPNLQQPSFGTVRSKTITPDDELETLVRKILDKNLLDINSGTVTAAKKVRDLSDKSLNDSLSFVKSIRRKIEAEKFDDDIPF